MRNLLGIGHLVNREKLPFVFSAGLEFEDRDVPLDFYYLGACLGDGDHRNTGIANVVGPEIVDWLVKYVVGENAQEFYNIQVGSNEPFLRDDFLVLLASRNDDLTEEQEINNKSYQSLLEDDEVLPDVEDIEIIFLCCICPDRTLIYHVCLLCYFIL